MRPTSLGIIGLGAVGGSVALAARKAGVERVAAYSESGREVRRAAQAGALTEIAHHPEGAVRGAEFVVVATPLEGTVDVLRAIAPLVRERGSFCTDLDGVKRPVVAAAEQLGLAGVFAGSHPIVTAAADGFPAARATLLEDAVVYVTPLAGGERAAAEVADFWRRVTAAHPVTVTAERHDAVLAWTEHLPRAVAAALAAALAQSGPAGVTYGGGALEATRPAAADPAAVGGELVRNRDRLLAALDTLGASVDALKAALRSGDRKAVERWLATGTAWRRRLER